MALINCPDCGTEVSDAAAACPKMRATDRVCSGARRVDTADTADTKERCGGRFCATGVAFGGRVGLLPDNGIEYATGRCVDANFGYFAK